MSGGNAPLPYQPSGQAQADTGYQSVTRSQGAPAASVLGQIPQLQTLAGNIASNPYNQQALTGAQGASAYGTGTLAPQMAGAAQSLTGAGNAAAPFGSQALQTGFDPQGALYNQQYQQMLQQQNAINAQNGVASTPYGAGLTGQSAQNFNTNWLNQEAARQAQAAGTYSTLTGAQNNAYTGAANLGQGAYGTMAGASALPSQTYTGQMDQALQALIQSISGQAAAFGPSQGLTGQYGNYLGLGQNATQIADQATQINNAAQTAGFSGLMNLLGLGSGGGGLFGFLGGLGGGSSVGMKGGAY